MRIHHRTCAVPFHLTNPDVLRRVSRSLHKCSLGAVKLEKMQSNVRTDMVAAVEGVSWQCSPVRSYTRSMWAHPC
jgi:hypothetical protein